MSFCDSCLATLRVAFFLTRLSGLEFRFSFGDTAYRFFLTQVPQAPPASRKNPQMRIEVSRAQPVASRKKSPNRNRRVSRRVCGFKKKVNLTRFAASHFGSVGSRKIVRQFFFREQRLFLTAFGSVFCVRHLRKENSK